MDVKTGSMGMTGSLGVFRDRVPQKPPQLPAGTRIVSADNHICLGGEDVWFDRVPEALKSRVPRVWFDEVEQMWLTGFNGKSLYPFGSAAFVESMEGREGAWNVDVRTADLAAEGVEKEIAFPQLLPVFFHHPDLELRGWIFRAYNQYLADLQKRQPGHFYGVGIANYWDPAAMADSIREIAELGLKTFMLPCDPGKDIDGKPVVYADDALSPLWIAAEAAGLPVCFHIGENLSMSGRGALGTTALHSLGAIYFRKIFGELTFGGILDRHPSLNIVFSEGNLHWIAGMLQDAELIMRSFGTMLDHQPALTPQEYWHGHCYATFMADPVGLSRLDLVGVDRAMWSVDYLHNESTFGHSGDVIAEIISAAGAEGARKMLGATAIELFKLDD